MRFSIVVTTGNAALWISRCIQSVAEQQTHWGWQCLLVDDATNDGTEREIQATLNAIDDPNIRKRFRVQRNASQRGALANLVDGFQQLGTAARPMDVLIPIDGDDWLFSSSALETIANSYEEENCWLTYGGLITSPGGQLCCTPVSDEVIAACKHRESAWLTSHLRSFRSHLWHSIREEDLRDPSGNYYQVTWDMAIMFPMLEMAEERIHCVDRAVYTYNTANPNSDHTQRRQQQFEAEQEIRGKRCYDRLTQASPSAILQECQNTLGFVILSDENPAQTIRQSNSLRTHYGNPRIRIIHNPFASPLGAIHSNSRLTLEPIGQDFKRGSWSQVEALLRGLRSAWEQWSDTEWFAVLDHESHPLININNLLDILSTSDTDGYLHAEAIIPHDLQSAWQTTCWQRYGNQEEGHVFSEDFTCYAGSPWMLLRRSAVTALLDFHEKHPWLAEHYTRRVEGIERTAPEESYIHTALCNQKQLNFKTQPICWEDWGQGWPRILEKADWNQLQASQYWFARRFRDPQSSRLIDRIQDQWMTSASHLGDKSE